MSGEEKFGYTYIPWTTPDGKKEMWRIPRAFQADGVFMSGTEAVLDAMYRKDPQLVFDWFRDFTAYTVVPGLPPLIAEAAEQFANKDFFTGAPIVPRSLERGYAHLQYTPYTSKLSIKLAEILREKTGLDMSPARLDHSISGVLGGLGRDASLLFGSGIDDMDREGELADWWLFGGLFQRGGQAPRRSKTVDKVYDLHEEAVKLQLSLPEEDPITRNKRLALADAGRAMSIISNLASIHEDKVDARRALMAYRLEIARKAIAEFESDHPRRTELSRIRKEMQERLKQAESQ